MRRWKISCGKTPICALRRDQLNRRDVDLELVTKSPALKLESDGVTSRHRTFSTSSGCVGSSPVADEFISCNSQLQSGIKDTGTRIVTGYPRDHTMHRALPHVPRGKFPTQRLCLIANIIFGERANPYDRRRVFGHGVSGF